MYMRNKFTKKTHNLRLRLLFSDANKMDGIREYPLQKIHSSE